MEHKKTMIRTANEQDLKQIAEIHRICFPDSMTTKIGRLEQFYLDYLKACPDLFILATNDMGKTIGFCVGYLMSDSTTGLEFRQHNALYITCKMVILLLKGDKETWQKCISKYIKRKRSVVTNQKYIGIPQSSTGDLMSICVIPEYRGCGVAGEMIEKFIETLKEKQMKRCILTVDYKNSRGISFYKKHGFTPYREIEQQCITFARLLD